MLELRSIAKNALPVLCVVCALVWLPVSHNLRLSPHSGDQGPLHIGGAWRSSALQGQRSADLREFFRFAERWPAGFVSRSLLLGDPLRAMPCGVSGSRVERWQLLAIRRSLVASRDGGLKEDGPAQRSQLL